ncbi:MAG: hypothetical protein AAGF98_12325 [Cyanobacteria bacterium P01_H01_bin.153]
MPRQPKHYRHPALAAALASIHHPALSTRHGSTRHWDTAYTNALAGRHQTSQ